MQNAKIVAKDNLRRLFENSYPGRGIILGLDDSGQNLIQVYWTMGRGEDSRNRVLTKVGLKVITEVADPAKVKKHDPNLFYTAMSEFGPQGKYVVSNGIQTDRVADGSVLGESRVLDSLRNYKYEEDPPNNTPRITGVSYLRGRVMADLAILRRSSYDDSCRRFLYRYETIPQGFGYFISTYLGDSSPLQSWEGEPRLMPIDGCISDIANTYWSTLNESNKVSLVVRRIPFPTRPFAEDCRSETLIINKYEKTSQVAACRD